MNQSQPVPIMTWMTVVLIGLNPQYHRNKLRFKMVFCLIIINLMSDHYVCPCLLEMLTGPT